MGEFKKMEKVKYLLVEVLKQKDKDSLIRIIKNSYFQFEQEDSVMGLEGEINLHIKVTPHIFTKYLDCWKNYEKEFKYYFNMILEFPVAAVVVKPDYDKLLSLNNEIIPVTTPWEEINNYQIRLIENLSASQDPIDFQNVGNTSRTILDKVAREVFSPKIHMSKFGVDVSNGQFKNQLHTYIAHVLAGKRNKEFRKFAETSIEFVKSAIDMMNSTTHKHHAELHFAELCVISTISAVNVIKTLYEQEKRDSSNLNQF